MDIVYFLIRFTPFWSIPGFLIGGEYAYLFWVRKKKRRMVAFLIFALCCGAMTVFYWVAGGPEKSVRLVKDLFWFYTR